jgi:hypothetical protein
MSDDEQSENPIILSIIHHRQNPLGSYQPVVYAEGSDCNYRRSEEHIPFKKWYAFVGGLL